MHYVTSISEVQQYNKRAARVVQRASYDVISKDQ